MPEKIYEFDNFVDPMICDYIVAWFRDQPKVEINGAQKLFNGRTIDFRNISNYVVKQLMNKFKFDATKQAMEIFQEPTLYPDYTDLVLWESGSGMLVHADNCDSEGNPNYVDWRVYSGVVFLNDEYLGGEPFFPNFGPRFVKPKKGKFILYPSGLDHSHGVATVVGTRYTMPIWFTRDYNHIEA